MGNSTGIAKLLPQDFKIYSFEFIHFYKDTRICLILFDEPEILLTIFLVKEVYYIHKELTVNSL